MLINWIICCLEFTLACAIYDIIWIKTKNDFLPHLANISPVWNPCDVLLLHTKCKRLKVNSRSKLIHLINSKWIKCILVHTMLQIHKLESWCQTLMISKSCVENLCSSNVYRWLCSCKCLLASHLSSSTCVK